MVLGELPRLGFTCCSRNITLPNSAFDKATVMLNEIAHLFNPLYDYCGEVIAAPRQSTISYSSVPPRYYILYDIVARSDNSRDNNGGNRWLSHQEVAEEAKRLGLLSVRILYDNGTFFGDDEKAAREMDPIAKAQEFIDQIEAGTLVSMLGGRVEGIVIKHPCFDRGTFQ